MIQPKFLVAAFALVGLLTTSGFANADGKMYVEVGGTWASVSDVDAEFTTENLDATWDLDDMIGAKLQIGGDFGAFRTDLKIRALYGGIDSISNVTNVSVLGPRYAEPAQILVATINAYWDITDYKISDGDAFITPYVGVGAGHGLGFLEADGNLGGVPREDHRNDHGAVYAVTGGALFSVNEHLGLSAEYEYIDTNVGGLDAHSANIGLRVTF